MRILKISLLILILSISISAQWYDKTNNLPQSRCDAIDAYDSLIATGSYTVNASWIPDSLYMTINGGNNWFGTPFPNSIEIGDGPTDISIKGADKIWFCTGNGKIYRTTDGGLNWQLQFYDTLLTKFMNYLEMFDEMNGMAMGDAPAVDKPALFLKTSNGGQDWISQNQTELLGLHSGDTWRRVDFANTDVGYFYTFHAFPPTTYKTTNGGQNWQVVNDTIHCWVLKAYDENYGWIYAGGGGTLTHMYRTTNGGHGGLIISVEDDGTDIVPSGYSLAQNYPNPFNPATKIKFEIPGLARNDNALVTLKVYDLRGREIATLVNEEKPAGEYEVEFDGNGLTSGIYFYQLNAGSFVETKKMILLK